jgi:hypothetical protein
MRRLKASLRAAWFFLRILGTDTYDEQQVGVAEAAYCSGVIFDLWMGRFG